MALKRRYRAKSHYSIRHLTPNEFRAIAFIATLILASIAIITGEKDPVVWGFLGTAIGISFGYPTRQ
jgi:hypothetical protein